MALLLCLQPPTVNRDTPPPGTRKEVRMEVHVVRSPVSWGISLSLGASSGVK